jgi:hypothetical protein
MPEPSDVLGREVFAPREQSHGIPRDHPEQEEVEGEDEQQGHDGLQALAEQVPP